jgi:hypothetical protein
MTDQNGFFRFLWRFNALALAAVFVIGAGLAVFAVVMPLLRPKFDAPVGHYSPVPKAAETDATYRIEDNAYTGYTFVTSDRRERLLMLRRWSGSPASYGLANQLVEARSFSSPVALNAVNLLVVNADTGDSHWLFKGYARAIGLGEPIYPVDMSLNVRSNFEPQNAAPTGMILRVHERDDNGDGTLDEKDHTTLYAYQPGKAEPIRLLTADLILSTNQVSAEKYAVVYEKQKAAFVAIYATSDFHLISERPMPNVPK